MAIRNVRYDTDEVLRKRSREIEEIDNKIRELALDMIDTMYKYDGVGLAAPQVGILKRIIVIDLKEIKNHLKICGVYQEDILKMMKHLSKQQKEY